MRSRNSFGRYRILHGDLMCDTAGHVPVMLAEVLELLQAENRRTILDCTLGLGGHAEAILAKMSENACYIGLDRDKSNLEKAEDRLRFYRRRDSDGNLVGEKLRLFHSKFSEAVTVLDHAGCGKVDAVLADIGVASTHLDSPDRGFSFQVDGPLDMRMDNTDGASAADIVNRTEQHELANLIYRYGQERKSRRIAEYICNRRREKPFETTGELADVIVSAVGRRRDEKIHPATRTFQALRIAVNDELGELERLLECLPRILAPGGRAVIISFHSLEDRCVKIAFSSMKSAKIGKIITPKPLVPDDEEIRRNPRSRSAKLRCIEMLNV